MFILLKDIFIGSISLLYIYIAMYGIGSLYPLKKTIYEERGFLYPTIGISVFTFIVGWLDLLHKGSKPIILCIATVGVLIGIHNILKNYKPTNNKSGAEVWILYIVSFLLMSMGFVSADYNDDVLAYYPSCLQLLSTGSSFEPFGFRRAISLGGQYPLQSLGISLCGTDGGMLYNISLSTLLLLIIIITKIEKGENIKERLIIISISTCLLFFPIGDLNSAPGSIVSLILIVSLLIKNEILTNILLATCISMRTQSIPFVALLLIYSFIKKMKENGIKESIKSMITSITIITIYLAPFAINNAIQFNTILPFGIDLPFLGVFHTIFGYGTIKPEYTNLKGNINDALKNIIMSPPLVCSIILAAVASCWKETRRIAIPVILSTIIISLMIAKLKNDGVRYMIPYLSASSTVFIIYILKNKKNLWWVPFTLSIYIALLTASYTITLHYLYTKSRINFPNKEEKYLSIKTQDIIPTKTKDEKTGIERKTTIAVVSAYPTEFDYKKHLILNIDVQPSTGNIPTSSKKDEWLMWANKHKVDYLIYPNRNYNPNLFTKPQYIRNKENPWDYKEVWEPNMDKEEKYILELKNQMPTLETYGYIIIKLK